MSRQTSILEALSVAQKYVYLHAEGVVFHVSQHNALFCKLNFVRLSEYNTDVPQKSQLTICLVANILKDLISTVACRKNLLQAKAPQKELKLSKHIFPVQWNLKPMRMRFIFPQAFKL